MYNTMDQKKLLYLMNHLDSFIEDYVYDVLADSEEDPQYSAVTASNLINAYRDVMAQLGHPTAYSDLRSYFAENLLSEAEYAVFCQKIASEKEYYIGTIFE